LIKIIDMEKRSRHYGDVARWIENVIDSCETWEQTRVASRLVTNFDNQLKDTKNYHSLKWTVIESLHNKIDYLRLNLTK
jgi:hypothetical protein